MINLLFIDLHANRIVKIADSTFNSLTNLEVVYLQENQLKQINLSTINSVCINRIQLANNPISKYLSLINVSRDLTGLRKPNKYSHFECVQAHFKNNYRPDLQDLRLEPEEELVEEIQIIEDETKLIIIFCLLIVLVFGQCQILICLIRNK